MYNLFISTFRKAVYRLNLSNPISEDWVSPQIVLFASYLRTVHMFLAKNLIAENGSYSGSFCCSRECCVFIATTEHGVQTNNSIVYKPFRKTFFGKPAVRSETRNDALLSSNVRITKRTRMELDDARFIENGTKPCDMKGSAMREVDLAIATELPSEHFNHENGSTQRDRRFWYIPETFIQTCMSCDESKCRRLLNEFSGSIAALEKCFLKKFSTVVSIKKKIN